MKNVIALMKRQFKTVISGRQVKPLLVEDTMKFCIPAKTRDPEAASAVTPSGETSESTMAQVEPRSVEMEIPATLPANARESWVVTDVIPPRLSILVQVTPLSVRYA